MARVSPVKARTTPKGRASNVKNKSALDLATKLVECVNSQTLTYMALRTRGEKGKARKTAPQLSGDDDSAPMYVYIDHIYFKI